MSVLVAFAAMSLFADLERHIYPLAKQLETPPVVLDVSEFPESKAWGEAAKALVERWFPIVTSMLATQDYRVPDQIRIRILPTANAPAFASGNTITINGKWITDRPDDLGMVIHELVHVVQQYPRNDKKPGWLVEGIADYIRWWRYEPEAPRPRIDYEKANFTDSYRTTAYFLAWVSRRYDMRLVPTLDLALRKAEDPMPIFRQLTEKNVEELWKEFIASRP
ncbi:MAG: DUF4157 domain-containing protein [Fimbriimonadales bacterium]|nr:DUF4157 domain-containing protein [Fimbriimonadales bacterium]